MATSSNTNLLDDSGAYPLPTLVVAAFNRQASLLRLLRALAQAHYPSQPVRLVISIDQSPTPDVVETANAFAWAHGPKEVIHHPQPLGLKAHLLACGNLSQRFGTVVVLEDDLMVSPHFYSYLQQSLAFYEQAPRIAGISLYHHELAESSQLPFQPLTDDSDVYFLQWPSSWGQVWTAPQWLAFRDWLEGEPQPNRFWPNFVQEWEPGSWKRLFLAYLRAKDLYFVFPRTGLSSHFGEAGEHSVVRGAQQTPLQTLPRSWRFAQFEESLAVYDSWFEPLSRCLQQLVPSLKEFDFSVDLYGQKEPAALSAAWTLTTRSQGLDQSVKSWSTDLLPLVQNIVADQHGEGIALIPTSEVASEPLPKSAYLARLSGWHRLQTKVGGSENMSISAIIPWEKASEDVEQTLRHLLEQVDLKLEIILVKPPAWDTTSDPRIRTVDWQPGHSYWQALETGCRAASGDLLFWQHPGAKPPAGLLVDCLAIMGDYDRIEWLLLRPDEMLSLPAQRWTLDRLGRASLSVLQAQMGPGFHIWRRSLFQKLAGNWQNEVGLWSQLAGKALPFSADLLGAGVEPHRVPWTLEVDVEPLHALRADRSWPGIWLSQALRPFFLTNSGLRWAHMQLEHFPPVLRREKEKWEMKRF